MLILGVVPIPRWLPLSPIEFNIFYLFSRTAACQVTRHAPNVPLECLFKLSSRWLRFSLACYWPRHYRFRHQMCFQNVIAIRVVLKTFEPDAVGKRINVFFTETTRDRKQIMDEYSFDGPGL